MKEKISRQIIRLLRDIVDALRVRDSDLDAHEREMERALARMDAKIGTLLKNQSNVLRRLEGKIEEASLEAKDAKKELAQLSLVPRGSDAQR